ncbi:WD repeat-containing protein YMR102C-like [Ananas comosus]|uniref:WD repeat-containing protein YMR102C-like n=1 Tax=Ananas comosus TaxID=4615 RepID=A0A6P5H1Y7_ANACO|nr:WD repeat-containing protein YMR102C-like [Ananas comosus]XP_020111923.1 WD repeat-containing protein YMR102C-like [Ananas comosus]
MLSPNEPKVEGEDIFYDAFDNIRISIDSSSSEDGTFGHKEGELRKFDYSLWTGELMSVQERRSRFITEVGFDGLLTTAMSHLSHREEGTSGRYSEAMESERITSSSGAVLDSSSSDQEVAKDCAHCIRDLDSGKRFIVHDDGGKQGLISMFKEGGSENFMNMKEFETLIGLSRSFLKFLRRELPHKGQRNKGCSNALKKNPKRWWRNFSKRRHAPRTCVSDILPKITSVNRFTRVSHQRKKYREFTALYMGQEIQAHKGLIRAMQFSPSGWYLASGGEDCIVRIWQIREAESCCKSFTSEVSYKSIDGVKDVRIMLGKDGNSAPVVIPKRVVEIEETPLHEFQGHKSDILDISWSKTDRLLTSSKDKTVRMWKVGCDGCLAIFQHKDYVTSVQFNPADERYFISGSIDGKVRVWDVLENRVIDWVDIRDVVTAVCYRPDGEGFVVGSITGNCRFYDYSGENLELDTQHCINKKKSAGNRITGLQFASDDSERVMITSADSKIRLFDGVNVIKKFKGLRKAKTLSPASFTPDGRYIISVGNDSHVYIWNSDGSTSPCSKVDESINTRSLIKPSSKGPKSIDSFESFVSKGVSLAAAWPGVDKKAGNDRSKSSFDPSSIPKRILEPSTLLRDPDCLSLGAWLFSNGLLRGTATWPEEKLPPPSDLSSMADDCSLPHRCLASMSASWNSVIATASDDGIIRAFHNYGLPVRL